MIEETIEKLGLPIDDIWYDGRKIYVDISRDERFGPRNIFGGTSGEYFTAGSIVKTLAQFPDVEEIEILIGGESDLWQGHLDYSGAFTVDAEGRIWVSNREGTEIYRAF